jgi:rsbT antagonist protein RsbS
MPVPILKQGRTAIASLRSSLTDPEWELFRQRMIERTGEWRSTGSVIDLTQMDVIDSFAARSVRDMVAVLRLRGVETVVVGIQPEVAFAMVQLGLRLEGVAVALDLEEGLSALEERLRVRRHGHD